MARLSANGTELARMQLIQPTPKSKDVVQRETTYVLMSNCRILKKLVVVFKPNEFSRGKNRRHDYGWKRSQLAGVKGKEPNNEEVERWVRLLEKNGFQRIPTR